MIKDDYAAGEQLSHLDWNELAATAAIRGENVIFSRVTALNGVVSLPPGKGLTDSHILEMNDLGYFLEIYNAGPKTITVPLHADVPFPIGTVVFVRQTGAGEITVEGVAGVDIVSSNIVKKTRRQYAEVKLTKISTNLWYFDGADAFPPGKGLTDSHTLNISDFGYFLEIYNVDPKTITVPLHADVPFPIGTIIPVRQTGAGQISFVPVTGVQILSSNNATKTSGQYAEVRLKKISTDLWYLDGDKTV